MVSPATQLPLEHNHVTPEDDIHMKGNLADLDPLVPGGNQGSYSGENRGRLSRNRKIFYATLAIGFMLLLLVLSTSVFAGELGNERFFIMIEAGSSHTAVFVYKFSFETTMITEIGQMHEVFPGLSHLANQTSQVKTYIRPLVEHAWNALPKTKKGQVYAFLYASSGLRTLQKSQQDIILEQCFDYLSSFKNKALRVTRSAVTVISGKQEGVFAWLALHGLLSGQFRKQNAFVPIVQPGSSQSKLRELAKDGNFGVIDFGGGSIQTVYDLTRSSSALSSNLEDVEQEKGAVMARPEDLQRVLLFGKEHILFVRSFEGFGRESLFSRYLQELSGKTGVYSFNRKGSNEPALKDETVIPTPCLLTGEEWVGTLKGGASTDRLAFRGTGNFSQCQAQLRTFNIFRTSHDAHSQFRTCNDGCDCPAQFVRGINGSVIPPAPPKMPFIGISNFGFSMDALSRVGKTVFGAPSFHFPTFSGIDATNKLSPTTTSHEAFTKATDLFCRTEVSSVSKHIPEDPSHRTDHCFTATAITELVDKLGLSDRWLESASVGENSSEEEKLKRLAQGGLHMIRSVESKDDANWIVGAAMMEWEELKKRLEE
ncbi:putative Nucleoside-diphosphatase mig-23 [Blattamonas nauphoetae]|uniref:Nucleoside-diphosphatase mig-23 n=1 Tax=Blattamonas nauphoetae TaxID=2049346 RepID=A0ABQ9Y9I7_9EUKA|nr:putative Nucleoside-diphosphatase mig-23 [Blattamonas nauphoetae]